MTTRTKRWPFMQVDIETLSTSNRAAIIQIAARPFSVDETCEDSFCVTVQGDIGVRSKSTIEWWEARSNMPDYKNGLTTQEALIALSEFFAKHCGENVKVWCQGANFDATILEAHYANLKMEAPWGFWNVCCNRTLKHISTYLPVNNIKWNTRSNHDALDDVDRQIKNVQGIFEQMTNQLVGAAKEPENNTEETETNAQPKRL